MTNRNAIVVGAGHNGLVAACYLAKSGYQVLVLEKQARIGGAADTRCIQEGFFVPGCAHLTYQMDPGVIKDLKLEEHGLIYANQGLESYVLAPDGDALPLYEPESNHLRSEDQQGLKEFMRLSNRFAKFLNRQFQKPPARIVNNSRREQFNLASMALDLRRMGKTDMRDFLRIIGINIYDVLNEYVDNELLKGGIGLDAVLGTHQGPRSPNSVLTYLYRISGALKDNGHRYAQVKGGMNSLVTSLTNAAKSLGVTIKTDCPVEQILVEHGRATGVRLKDGETIRSLTVVSNADPKNTVFNLVGAKFCETGFVKRMHHARASGSAAKLHLALDGLPQFSGLPQDKLGQRLLLAPTMDYVERAFNPAKYGETSRQPVMEITLPSVHDSALAPEGQHVLSAVVQYVPYELKRGWHRETKRDFFETCISTLEAYSRDIRNKILAAELLTPADLEQDYGMTGGHWHHVELALDQFYFVRPVVGASRYQMPVEGLYLCGAGTHPGGGISGLCGKNAAGLVLSTEQSP